MCVCLCLVIRSSSPLHLHFPRVNLTSNSSEPSRQVQELSRDQPFARCTSSSARCNWKGDLTPCLAPICSLQIHRTAVSNLLRTEAWSAPAFSGTAMLRSHGVQPAARPASEESLQWTRRGRRKLVEGGRGCFSQIVERSVCPLSSVCSVTPDFPQDPCVFPTRCLSSAVPGWTAAVSQEWSKDW